MLYRPIRRNKVIRTPYYKVSMKGLIYSFRCTHVFKTKTL